MVCISVFLLKEGGGGEKEKKFMDVCYVCIWVCAVVDVCESKGGGSAGNNQCIVLVHRGSL